MRGSAGVCAVLAVLVGCGGEPPGTGSVRGVLTFNVTEALEPEALPRAGHPIEIDGPVLDTVLTGDGGEYVITELPPGSYQLLAELGVWSVEDGARAAVEVRAGEVTEAPELRLTAAGLIRGSVAIDGGGDPAGFRLQLLGTSLGAVTGAGGDFTIYRVPVRGETAGAYELLAERADVGAARRAGIAVQPFLESDIGVLTVTPGGSGTQNAHPRFTGAAITFTSNGTPPGAAEVPLPYLLPPGTVRRFDQVRLEAPARDDDGDPLSYEWSASAGDVIHALSAQARWRPDEYAGSRATVSVTVRDGHGGIAHISTDIDILDVVAGSAHRLDDRVAHSYRIEGGAWRIDVVELGRPEDPQRPEDAWTGDVVTQVVELDGAADPRPLLFPDAVVYRDYRDYRDADRAGALVLHDLRAGASTPIPLTPAADSAAQSAVLASPTKLWVIAAGAPEWITEIDIPSGNTRIAASCPSVCTQIAADGEVVVGYGGGTFVYSTGLERGAGSPVGRGMSFSGGSLAYVDGDSGSGSRSSVALMGAAGGVQEVYEGYYEVVVWSHRGDDVLITEQEYRSLRHAPFVRRVRGGRARGDYPRGDDQQGWMADRVYGISEDTEVALIRRITRADWPEDFDASRSEITRVDIERAFIEPDLEDVAP